MMRPFNNLYIHVPFCEAKCGYCIFYSEEAPSDELINSYLDRLRDEFLQNSGNCDFLDTIYIGGGTPSLLSPVQLERLFTLIDNSFSIASDAEISIECNPETINSHKASIISKFANRISFGVQSFDRKLRKLLGRRGSIEDINEAVLLMRKYGIKNINLDLIYGIPTQTLDIWREELIQALELGVEHISTYSLTVEEGSALAKSKLEPTCDDIVAEMWTITDEKLAEYALSRYEISNFAKDGLICRHNNNIWHGATYLGCGPAAASFNGVDRQIQIGSLSAWLNAVEPEKDIITAEARAREIFVMGLRTRYGWNTDEFEDLTGFNPHNWSSSLKRLSLCNLIDYSEHYIKPTPTGMLFWDSIAEELI